jgi:hypothetical protein
MAGTCPHCGASLTGVGDAFCPACRRGLDEPPAGAEPDAPRRGVEPGRPAPRPDDRNAHPLVGVVLLTLGGLWLLSGATHPLPPDNRKDFVYVLGWLAGGICPGLLLLLGGWYFFRTPRGK